MRHLVAPPYLSAKPERIQIQDWYALVAARPVPLAEAVKHWDPATELMLRQPLKVDIDGVREDCEVGKARLLLMATWHSTGTRLGGRGTVIELGDGRFLGEVAIDLPSAEQAYTVKLRTTIVLGATPKQPSLLTARRPGAILWSEEHSLPLEGSGSRFPTELQEFGSFFPPGAAWYLGWSPQELEEPVLGSVRLYLNRRHPLIERTALDPAGTELGPVVAEAIRLDVARAMLMGALAEDEFHQMADQYEEGSVGRLVHSLVRLLFPNESTTAVRSLVEAQPARFEAKLQAALKLWWTQ